MTAAANKRPKRPKVTVAPLLLPQQQQQHFDLEPQQKLGPQQPILIQIFVVVFVFVLFFYMASTLLH